MIKEDMAHQFDSFTEPCLFFVPILRCGKWWTSKESLETKNFIQLQEFQLFFLFATQKESVHEFECHLNRNMINLCKRYINATSNNN